MRYTGDQWEEFLTQQELCRKLKFTRRTILERTRDGTIPFVQIGESKRYHWPTVRAALLAGKAPDGE